MTPTIVAALTLLLLGCQVQVRGAADWWVDPLTIKVTHDRQKPYPSSAKAVDMAGQRGECERASIWGFDTDTDNTDVQVRFTDLKSGASVLPASQWTYR